MAFSEWLEQQKKNQGFEHWNQLAEWLGVNKNTITVWKRGGDPGYESLKTIYENTGLCPFHPEDRTRDSPVTINDLRTDLLDLGIDEKGLGLIVEMVEHCIEMGQPKSSGDAATERGRR